MENFDDEKKKKRKFKKPVIIGCLVTGSLIAATVCAVQFQPVGEKPHDYKASPQVSEKVRLNKTQAFYLHTLSDILVKFSEEYKREIKKNGAFKSPIIRMSEKDIPLSGKEKLPVDKAKVGEILKEIDAFSNASDQTTFTFKTKFLKSILDNARKYMKANNFK